MIHWDGAGNVPPQRALARELRRRGHDVHVLTHDSLAETVRSDGATFHHLVSFPQWDFARRHTAEEELEAIVRHVSSSPSFVGDALTVADRVQPEVCLIDAMLITTLAGALERGLHTGAILHLAWNPGGDVFGLLDSITRGLPGEMAGSSFVELMTRVPLILATSYPDLGTDLPAAPHIQFVGPIREPVSPSPWPRRCPDRKFVLVSLSSGFQGQEATLDAICEALTTLPVEALVTTGRGIEPDHLPLSGPLAARAFVPHDAVLPSVDLVITHGGLGTVMYALGAGVPCLCIPNGRDQDDNAARIAALGLGSVLSPSAKPGEIRERVNAMLSDGGLADRTRRFSQRVPRFGDLRRAARLATMLAGAVSHERVGVWKLEPCGKPVDSGGSEQ